MIAITRKTSMQMDYRCKTSSFPNPPWFKDARFGPLAVPSSSHDLRNSEGAAGASLASKISEAGSNTDTASAAKIVTGALVKKMAETLRIPPSEVDPSRAMYHYGVDSLVALELRNARDEGERSIVGYPGCCSDRDFRDASCGEE
ncbi:hypothetical protein N7524_007795 [Penicillium chrysogenum]|nr:hypothetical protein N7524_007795 [Penicillium chrysogenum]